MVQRPRSRLLIQALCLASTLLFACGDDEGGSDADGGGGSSSDGSPSGTPGATSGTAGGGTAGSSTAASASGSSSGGGAKDAICEAYAQLVIDCCDPPVPNCAPDQKQGWVDFCLGGYEGCPKAYDCLAMATCETKDQCPDFGSGCQ